MIQSLLPPCSLGALQVHRSRPTCFYYHFCKSEKELFEKCEGAADIVLSMAQRLRKTALDPPESGGRSATTWTIYVSLRIALHYIYIAFRNLLQKQSLIETAFVVAKKIAILLPKNFAIYLLNLADRSLNF